MTCVTPRHRLAQERVQQWEVGRKGPAGVTVAGVSLLPGAASVLVRDLLTGPRKPVQVLGSGASYTYLLLAGELVPVESSDGLGLPRAVRLAEPSARAPFESLGTGMSGFAGRDGIDLGTVTIRVSRWWEPRRAHTGVDRARLADVTAWLPPCPAVWSPTLPAARLLGFGPGLTPAGDDVLAGLLLGSRSDRRAHERVLAEVRAGGLHRTTALSAALLTDAAEGYAIPVVSRLLAWLAGRGAEPAEDVVGPVVQVGHTSGLALAWGVVAGAERALAESKEAA
jgi:hypothetical protein